MNSAVVCVFLLTCVTVCTSTKIINCHCATAGRGVKASLIAHVKEYKPRPYCNKHEVIVTLKNGNKTCLDPESDFTKAVLRTLYKQQRTAEALSDKMKTTRSKTTTAATTSSAATVSP